MKKNKIKKNENNKTMEKTSSLKSILKKQKARVFRDARFFIGGSNRDVSFRRTIGEVNKEALAKGWTILIFDKYQDIGNRIIVEGLAGNHPSSEKGLSEIMIYILISPSIILVAEVWNRAKKGVFPCLNMSDDPIWRKIVLDPWVGILSIAEVKQIISNGYYL